MLSVLCYHRVSSKVQCTLLSESHCAVIKGDGSDVHERRYRPEPERTVAYVHSDFPKTLYF
jgi:hypothetical protein